MAGEQIGEVLIDGATRPITVDRESGRFEIQVGDQAAFTQFRLSGPVLSLIHTEVPKAAEGKGLAAALARAALDYARAHSLGVKVICPFIAKYIARHPEYQDL